MSPNLPDISCPLSFLYSYPSRLLPYPLFCPNLPNFSSFISVLIYHIYSHILHVFVLTYIYRTIHTVHSQGTNAWKVN